MPESDLVLKLPDESATAALGQALARALPLLAPAPLVIYLHGPLGAGKTSLARSLLRALGVTGAVRSPTYTLMEIYPAGGVTVVHLDLYRLSSADELEALGLRELLEPAYVWLVEWPERGSGRLPQPDLQIDLQFDGEGRVAHIRAPRPPGRSVMAALKTPTSPSS